MRKWSDAQTITVGVKDRDINERINVILSQKRYKPAKVIVKIGWTRIRREFAIIDKDVKINKKLEEIIRMIGEQFSQDIIRDNERKKIQETKDILENQKNNAFKDFINEIAGKKIIDKTIPNWMELIDGFTISRLELTENGYECNMRLDISDLDETCLKTTITILKNVALSVQKSKVKTKTA